MTNLETRIIVLIMILRKNIKLFSAIAFIFCLNAACSHKETYVKTEGMIWNTIYHITYKGSPLLQDSVLPILNEVSRSLSVFEKTSLVSRLNDTTELEIDSHFITVYEAAKRINMQSGGRFDPTVSPLVDAWGFGLGHQAGKDTLAIDSILTFVGINKTQRNGNIITKEDKRIRFNFSAIAKGYGCDAVGEMFKRNGVKDFMVEIGGEIVLSGKSPRNKDWRIAIDSPVEEQNPGEEAAMILSLTDVGVATSGNYRNYRIEEGNKVAHTISAITGRPYKSDILSATVIASNCMEADGIATACMASTSQEAKTLLERIDNIEGLLILSDSVWMTSGFHKYVISKSSELGRTNQN